MLAWKMGALAISGSVLTIEGVSMPFGTIDANTNPRGGTNQEELARRHGETLGREVCRVVAGSLEPIRGPLRVQRKRTDLPLEHYRAAVASWQFGDDSPAAKLGITPIDVSGAGCPP
jgi:hypothetical protein